MNKNEEVKISKTFRYSEIIEIARSARKFIVKELSQHFCGAVQTIRLDLSDFATSGHLERVHGGAVCCSGTINIGYDERRILNTDAIRSIEKACAANIPSNVSIFLNIGTSTEAIANELLHHYHLSVVTNNMNFANILFQNTACEILVKGSQLHRAGGDL